jgi:hypothetical protein
MTTDLIITGTFVEIETVTRELRRQFRILDEADTCPLLPEGTDPITRTMRLHTSPGDPDAQLIQAVTDRIRIAVRREYDAVLGQYQAEANRREKQYHELLDEINQMIERMKK